MSAFICRLFGHKWYASRVQHLSYSGGAMYEICRPLAFRCARCGEVTA